MYGKAGACRVKPYGVEYRVLSNKWVSDTRLRKWAHRATQAAVEALVNGVCLYEEEDVQEIINTSDVKKAVELIEKYDLEVPNVG